MGVTLGVGILVLALMIALACDPAPTTPQTPDSGKDIVATAKSYWSTATARSLRPTPTPPLVPITPILYPPLATVTPTPTPQWLSTEEFLRQRKQAKGTPISIPVPTPTPRPPTPTPLPTATPVPTPTPVPPRDWKALLPQFEQYEEPNWYLRVMKWNSLERFEQGCKAGTLPEIPPTQLGIWVDEWGGFDRRSFWPMEFPRPVFKPVIESYTSIRYPLSANWYRHGDAAGLGLWCIWVSQDVEVRLVCEDDDRCSGQEPIVLISGYNFVLVHRTAGVLNGSYTPEMRCTRTTDTCEEGWFTGVVFSGPGGR